MFPTAAIDVFRLDCFARKGFFTILDFRNEAFLLFIRERSYLGASGCSSVYTRWGSSIVKKLLAVASLFNVWTLMHEVYSDDFFWIRLPFSDLCYKWLLKSRTVLGGFDWYLCWSVNCYCSVNSGFHSASTCRV